MSYFWRATVHIPFLLSYHKQVRHHVFLFRFVPGLLSNYICAGGSKFSFHYSGFSHFLLNFSGQVAVFSFSLFPPQFLCWTSSRRPAQMARRRRRSEEGFTFWELLTWRNATICKFVTVISGMISVNSYMIWVSKLCSTGSLGIATWKGKGAILEMTKGS